MSLYFLPSAFFLPLPLFKLIKFFFYPRFSFLLILKVACRVDVCPSEKYLMDISEIFKNSDHHSPFWSLTESTSIFFFFYIYSQLKTYNFFSISYNHLQTYSPMFSLEKSSPFKHEYSLDGSLFQSS